MQIPHQATINSRTSGSGQQSRRARPQTALSGYGPWRGASGGRPGCGHHPFPLMLFDLDTNYLRCSPRPTGKRLPLTDAAQAVQRSAFSGAYAQWTQAAVRLVTDPGSANPRATPGDLTQLLTSVGYPLSGGDGQSGGTGVSLPAGFALPSGTPPAVVTASGWALAQRGTPYSWGGDCTGAHSSVAALECDRRTPVKSCSWSTSPPGTP
jgi:hypothetical protein